MEIKTKLESIETIKKLGLNKMKEELFKKGEIEKVRSFLNSCPERLFCIRDRSKAGGNFKFNVKKEDVISEIEGYDLFTINISTSNYEGHQILTGDIKICSDNGVYATLSTDPNASVRSAYDEPTFNFNTTIFNDELLNQIPGFDFLYEYIFSHSLVDAVVEFSLFDINVGINNEKIVIFEIRTHY